MTRRHDPLISILIVNYNGRDHVDECFESLSKQTYSRFEVIMVDNGSKDGSADHVEKKFPQVKVVRAGKNLGFADGNNFGFPHCSGDFILLLNNDTRVNPDALKELAKAAGDFPESDVFSCFLLNYYKPEFADSAGDAIYDTGVVFSFRGYPAADFTLPRPLTSACAGAAMYSREAFAGTGLFDGDFFLIFEDVDLSLRARHRGYRILFLPSAKVYHKTSASLGGKRSALSIYYCERNFLPLLLKNFPWQSLARMAPALFALKFVGFLVASREGNFLPFLRGNFASLALVPRMLAKRKTILGDSRLSPAEFHAALRKHWFRERVAFRRGNFGIPH